MVDQAMRTPKPDAEASATRVGGMMADIPEEEDPAATEHPQLTPRHNAVLVILGIQLQLSISLSTLEEKLRDLTEAIALRTGTDPAWSGSTFHEADQADGDAPPGTQHGVDET